MRANNEKQMQTTKKYDINNIIIAAGATALYGLITLITGLLVDVISTDTLPTISSGYKTIIAIFFSLCIIIPVFLGIASFFYRRRKLQTNLAIKKLIENSHLFFDELDEEISSLLAEKVK